MNEIRYFKVKQTFYVKAISNMKEQKLEAPVISAVLQKRFIFPMFGFSDLTLLVNGGSITVSEMEQKPKGVSFS